MAKLSKKSRHPKAAAPARDSVAPRRKPADQRLRLLERLLRPALGRAYLARRITHCSAAAADHRRTLESREIDPPARFVRSQIARISQAIIVAHTMTMEGKFQAIDRMLELAGELDRSHSFV
jgi:hypothetical protein